MIHTLTLMAVRAAFACLLLWVCLPLTRLHSQDIPSFQSLDDLSLSHQTVPAIQQDSEGFLWFGTGDGLNRWDGYRVEVFRHDPSDPATLSGSLVTAIIRGRGDHLWVGTDNGVSLYDPRLQNFRRVQFADSGDSGESQEVQALLEDTQGRLWVVLRQSFWLVPPGTLRAERIQIGDRPAADLRIKALQEVEGLLWLEPRAEEEPLLKARVVDRRVVLETAVMPALPSGRLPTGSAWLGRRLPASLAKLSPSRLSSPILSRSEAPLLETSDGKVWLGSQSGLLLYDPERSEFSLHSVSDGGDQLSNFVISLFEDRDGTLWVGTYNGLFRRDPFQKPFRHFSVKSTGLPDTGSSRSTAVSALLLEEDRGIWVGTFGEGLILWDREAGFSRPFRKQAGNSASLCNDFIWSLHQGVDGVLWVGTPEGVCRRIADTDRFQQIRIVSDEALPVNVRSIASDALGRLWLATTSGLYRFDPSSEEVRKIRPAGQPKLLEQPLETILFSNSPASAQLWTGTADSQLMRLDSQTLQTTVVDLTQDLGTGRGLGVWALLEADNGTLWIGSGLGLSRHDPASRSLRHFGVRDGLPGGIVYSLAEDPQGRLWVGTNQGLTVLENPYTEVPEFISFGRADGVLNVEFNRRAALVDDEGIVFLGGLQGVTFFDSRRIRKNPRPPLIAVTSVEVEGPSGTRPVNPFQIDNLTLEPYDHAFSVHFAALSFTSPVKNRYRYQLEGLDPSWVEAGTERSVRYASLAPGEYTFRVSGSNADGVWNQEGRSIAVTVLPPFWRTIWFQGLILLFFLGASTLLYRYRVSRLLEMERLRLRVAEDLHDDLGSNLSGVALLGEGLLRCDRLEEPERRQLQRIAVSARRMVEDLRDIVWLVDPKQDTVEDLVARMREVAGDLLSETDYSFEAPPPGSTANLGMETRRQLFLVFKESIHNVSRHAAASRVKISLRKEAGDLVLSVSDNGIGLVEDKTTGQGMRSMRRRAGRLGAKLEIESAEGEGTQVTLRVKIT